LSRFTHLSNSTSVRLLKKVSFTVVLRLVRSGHRRCWTILLQPRSSFRRISAQLSTFLQMCRSGRAEVHLIATPPRPAARKASCSSHPVVPHGRPDTDQALGRPETGSGAGEPGRFAWRIAPFSTGLWTPSLLRHRFSKKLGFP
jgi:hypothetical protein